MKKLVFYIFILLFSHSLWAFNSSAFLISQSAFKNHDYSAALLNFNIEQFKFSNSNLLEKVIAAIITEDLILANKISNKILLEDSENQEAYIVKLVYFYYNEKFDEIKKFHQNIGEKNELIDFIFFNNEELKDRATISKALIDIVISSFSNTDQQSLNYNFLLFYTSLSKIIDRKNDRASLIKGELFQSVEKPDAAKLIFEKIKSSSPYYLDAQKSLAINYSNFSLYDEALENIKKILENSNYHYSLKKILADFYRTEKNMNLQFLFTMK